MDTSYHVVWVDMASPAIVEDVYRDYLDSLDEAIIEMRHANTQSHDDGLNWVARIQRVTREFV